MLKGLEHLMCRERLRDLGLTVQPRDEKTQGILSMCVMSGGKEGRGWKG